MMKSKANLFLIGAAKSGTTALAATLGQHPAIAPLPIKEPGHFSTDLRTPVFSSRYNRLLQWDEAAYFKKAPFEERHIGFVESELNYQKLVNQALTSNPDSKYVLDASTWTFSFSTCCRNGAIDNIVAPLEVMRIAAEVTTKGYKRVQRFL